MQTIPMKYRRKMWAEQTGWTWVRIATEVLNVTPQRVGEIMRSGVASPPQVEQLRNTVKMPEELLPKPTRGIPGVVPKCERQTVVQS